MGDSPPCPGQAGNTYSEATGGHCVATITVALLLPKHPLPLVQTVASRETAQGVLGCLASLEFWKQIHHARRQSCHLAAPTADLGLRRSRASQAWLLRAGCLLAQVSPGWSAAARVWREAEPSAQAPGFHMVQIPGDHFCTHLGGPSSLSSEAACVPFP